MEVEVAQDMLKQLALGLAVLCVRNTGIEDVHSGIEPASAAGDFSDVKVVTPYGEIPWNKTSRISNDEMRASPASLMAPRRAERAGKGRRQ